MTQPSGGTTGAGASSAPRAVAVTVPGAQAFDLEGADGRVHRVMVAVPPGPAPSAGFPVLYHLDGNAIFASMVEALRIQARRSAVTGVAPGIIVGIGYPVDGPFDALGRTLDYTPEADAAALGERPDGGAWSSTGGADAFLDMVESRVKPLIAGLAPVDASRQALLGQSLGGLLALHAVLTRPGAFASIVAISPSLWWNGSALLRDVERRGARPPDGRPRVMIAVGGEEEPAEAPDEDAHAARRRSHGLVTRARLFAERLPAEVFCVVPGENHGSVVHAMISQVLRFALPAGLPARN